MERFQSNLFQLTPLSAMRPAKNHQHQKRAQKAALPTKSMKVTARK
jgi:hypothetical protein